MVASFISLSQTSTFNKTESQKPTTTKRLPIKQASTEYKMKIKKMQKKVVENKKQKLFVGWRVDYCHPPPSMPISEGRVEPLVT